MSIDFLGGASKQEEAGQTSGTSLSTVAGSGGGTHPILAAFAQTLGKKPTVSGQISDLLRDLILKGDLKPGERIVESRIAKQLGVGQPTVREALVELEHYGLVVRRSNQGCIVTSLTKQETEQVLRIRAELEALAVELAVENRNEASVAELIAAARAMQVAAATGEIQRFYQTDLNFHQALWRMTGNSFLPRTLSQLMLPLLAFLFIRNMRENGKVDLVTSANAHLELAETIAEGDPKRARAVAEEKLLLLANQHLSLFDRPA